MGTLKQASPVLGNQVGTSLLGKVWPRDISAGDGVSVRRLIERFSGAGVALDGLTRATEQAWPRIDRGDLVRSIRDRILDPAIVYQNDLPFCGPASIAFELARRDPRRYVQIIAAAYAEGCFTTPNGRSIRAEQELLDGALPSPSSASRAMDPADWVLTATLRDDENVILDIHGDEAKDGASGSTMWDEMVGWTRDVLGLRSELIICTVSGEVSALRQADSAVRAGGVAFLNIDANLIKYGPGAVEEEIGFERLDHTGPNRGVRQPKCHSQDDAWLDHWVTHLGGLELADNAGDDSTSPIRMNLWSWGGEYTVSGTAAAFGEYLWAVVIGWP